MLARIRFFGDLYIDARDMNSEFFYSAYLVQDMLPKFLGHLNVAAVNRDIGGCVHGAHEASPSCI